MAIFKAPKENYASHLKEEKESLKIFQAAGSKPGLRKYLPRRN